MMPKTVTYLILFFVCIPGRLLSQDLFCGADQLRSLMKQNNPYVNQSEENANLLIYNNIISGKPKIQKQSGGIYSIPVVFHIMHDNGPENISDSIVQLAVDELNLRFQNAAPYYDSTGHQVNVQFCLASVDPQGNPTSGITRHQTLLTNFLLTTDNDIDLKNIARWSPDLYFNVYVVANITGFIDGYSTFPYNAGEAADGVVIEYIYIHNSFLFAHETGHYCGLYHTFQNGCYNQNCMLNGDNVCDTPPDNSSQNFACQGNSCTTDMDDTSGFNPFITDMNELPNYMDYTTCALSFSQGQSERMETSVSQLRSNLLNSNGCGTNAGQVPPYAGFNFTISPCNNGEVAFSDSTSSNSITTEWDLDNDGLFEFLGHDFTYIFPSSGIYLVRQRVNGIGGQDTISQTMTIYKGTTANFPMDLNSSNIIDTLKVCQGEIITINGVASGTSYVWSTGDTTQSVSFTADTSFQLSLSMVDSTGFTWTTLCTPLNILVSPFEVPVITYFDTIGYICEGSPVQFRVVNPLLTGNYFWFQYTVPNGWQNTGVQDTIFTAYPGPTYSSFYQVVYANDDSSCSAQSNVIVLQSQYLPFASGYSLDTIGTTMSYPNQNYIFQWYFNGQPIPGANSNTYTATQTGCYQLGAALSPYVLCETFSDTVCFAFTGINEMAQNDITIFPNPSHDILNIHCNYSTGKQTIKIYSLTGQEIHFTQIIMSNTNDILQLDISAIENGIYILEFGVNGKLRYEKLFIER